MSSLVDLQKSFDTDGQSEIFRYEMYVNHDEQETYKRMLMERIKEKIGVELYDLINRFKSPCVISIDEEITHLDHYDPNKHFLWMDKIRVTIRITNVHHRDVMVERFVPYSAPSPEKKLSMLDKIKSKLKRIK